MAAHACDEGFGPDFGRQRDLLPLPRPSASGPLVASVASTSCSRSCHRRHLRRSHKADMSTEIVDTLNEMFTSRAAGSLRRSGQAPTAAQREALSHIEASVACFGPPPSDISGSGALSELRSRLSYSGEPSCLAPLVVDAVSLPPVGHEPVELEILAGDRGRKLIERLFALRLPEAEGRARALQYAPRRPFSDPIIRARPSVYARLLHRLHGAGLVTWRRRAVTEVGVFTVWKKDGRQRLIIDGRVPSQWFGDPPSVSLATGQSFAAVELDDGPPLEIAGVDIADAFYCLKLPEELVEMFGMPPIRAGVLGLTSLGGSSLNGRDLIVPCFTGVPMGWPLSLWIC